MPAIENLTDEEKLQWAQAAGGFRLAGGAVTDVPYVDIVLPSGYDMLQLNIMKWATGTDTFAKDYIPAYVFSQDGGATWVCDGPIAEEDVGTAGIYYHFNAVNAGHYDSLGLFQWHLDTPDYVLGSFFVTPGSDTIPPAMSGDTGVGYTTGLFIEPVSTCLRSQFAQVNKLRLKAYGDGSATPTVNIPFLAYSLIGYAV